jgi:hypothetical protein
MSRTPTPMTEHRCPTCGSDTTVAPATPPASAQRTFASGIVSATASRVPLAPGCPLPSAVTDGAVAEQLARLRSLESEHLQPGTDLTSIWREFVTHPDLLIWLRCSDEVADSIKGRRDLVKKRRRGILRWLEGPDRGMPYYLPPHFGAGDPVRDREQRLFRLRDELEYIVIPFFRQWERTAGPRPVRDTLTHQLVRAILDWKASHLDMWLSVYPHLILGRIYLPIPSQAREVLGARAVACGKTIAHPREYLTEVRFDTTRFMNWYYANMN